MGNIDKVLSIPQPKNSDYRKAGLTVVGNKRRLLRDSNSLAILANIFFPGLGTIISGQWGKGFTQFVFMSVVYLGFFGSTKFIAYMSIFVFIPLWVWSFASVFGSAFADLKKY